MPEYKEFYAEDGSSVRAYKVEEPHEVETLTGRTTAYPGEYVVERDRPQYVDVVPGDGFEDGYSENEPSNVDDTDEGPSTLDTDSLKVEDGDTKDVEGDADSSDEKPVTAPKATRRR